MWGGNKTRKHKFDKCSTYFQFKPSVAVAAEKTMQSNILEHKILGSRSAKQGLFSFLFLFFNRTGQYISHFKFIKGQENVGQSWMEHLVADVHVVLMAIVSAVNLGFSRPRRAIPLYRLGR